MNVKRFFHTKILPSPMVTGMTLGMWLKVLAENKFSIDAPFLVRGVSTTVQCAMNSLWALGEATVFGKRIARLRPKAPLVILGHWRGGTTHLHNLLSHDRQFAAPTNYQVSFPETFLLTERLITRLFGPAVLESRPMDNMSIELNDPGEDEFALCKMTGMSQCLGWVFDRSLDRYEKYLTFEGVREEDIARWRQALQRFVKKVVLRAPEQTPVLKSPPHTGRIRYVLEAFPDAKFVHIHRHPCDVFRSMVHTWSALAPLVQMQRFDASRVERLVVERYKTMYRAFFEQRPLIPDGRFHEISYEDLVEHPEIEIRRMYEALNLPGFDKFRDELLEYIEGVRSYRPNVYDELPDETRDWLAREWGPMFEAWNYTA